MEVSAGEQKREVTSALPSEEFLSKLSETDRTHIQQIIQAYRQSLTERNIQGQLTAVGTSIQRRDNNEPNDIDLLTIIGAESPDTAWDIRRETALEYFTKKFNDSLLPIVQSVAARVPHEGELKTNRPAVDEEFQNPNILKHEGSVTLTFGSGKPIEFIQTEKGVPYSPAPTDKRSFSVLVTV